MTQLPAALDPGVASVPGWRLDAAKHSSTWDSGRGPEIKGGRWNPIGTKAVYCAIDPATTILEVAVHMGFHLLDTMPFVLTNLRVYDFSNLHVVMPGDVPNPGWLHNGPPSAGQQLYGADLLARHDFVLFPSVVSKHSWNLVFRPDRAAGKYGLVAQDRFGLDGRLNPPVAS